MEIKQLKELTQHYTVLYVEDDETIAKAFKSYLEKIFKKVNHQTNGQDGLSQYQKNPYDLVITDVQMPLMDGLEMSRKIKELNSEQNIMITSAYSDTEKFIDSIKIGIDGYILKPINFLALNNILYKITKKIKTFEEHRQYKEKLENLVHAKTNENLSLKLEKVTNYEQTLFALIDIIESRDTYTGKHSLRVAQYCQLIAQELGYSKEKSDELYKAGILHDIGKVAIPDSLLLKPTSLNEEEYELIKLHVNIGYHMLNQIPMFQNISTYINGHHERLDGSGYPNGLKDDEICEQALIMGVADSFDAMTTSRIYKHRKSIEDALLELEHLKGSHYAPKVVDAAKKVLKNIHIDHTINQDPLSSLEHERFSYFYKDNLTELHNERYLDFLLNKTLLENTPLIMNIILLNNFGNYNKTFGWTKGNLLLQNIANKLMELYENMLIFRIHGDDFIILSSTKKAFDVEKLTELNALIDKTNITISTKQLDVKKDQIDSILTMESLI